MRHRKNPLSRDLHENWEHIVVWSCNALCFIRYTDRSGEHSKPVIE